MLSSIDLFSGIGGMTLGLRGMFKPVVYCEIDPFCRQVLQTKMNKGLLPKAPIITDVRRLQRADVEGAVQCITAGFPCQGFSWLGHKKGFEQEQSHLFFEVLRIVDIFKPKFLFLENVANIVKMGMELISMELTSRGYSIRWCVLGASDVGAPHVRLRWFCLCTKGKLPPVLITERGQVPLVWARSAPPRMTLQRTPQRTARLAALGNAVVPEAARVAFQHLLNNDKGEIIPVNKGFLPVHGAMNSSGTLYDFPAPPKKQGKPMTLSFQPWSHRAKTQTPNNSRTSDLVRDARIKRYWATPRHSNVGASHVLTERSVRDLPTQVRFEKNTPDNLRQGALSPNFVEWMMGYPQQWTKIDKD